MAQRLASQLCRLRCPPSTEHSIPLLGLDHSIGFALSLGVPFELDEALQDPGTLELIISGASSYCFILCPAALFHGGLSPSSRWARRARRFWCLPSSRNSQI